MRSIHLHQAFLVALVGFLFAGCINKNSPEWDFGWKDASREEVEAALKSAMEKGVIDIYKIAAELSNNENIDRAVSAADGNSIMVKFTDSDDYYVFPIAKLEDPFGEDEATRSDVSAQETFQAAGEDIGAKASSTDRIAVFNYFSNDLSRSVQNGMLNYMMHDAADHGFFVEYYPYEKMTISNLVNVKSNEKNYKAVIIITHGFTFDGNSYFVLGEEYDKSRYDASYRLLVGPDNAQQKVPWSLRFWNQGFGAFGFDSRYDCAIDVSKMKLWEHTILYMGSCDAFRCDEPPGTSIGWDGNNVTAQAHVTLLMYNLMRGKSLADALDQQEEPYYAPTPYHRYTGEQKDTWLYDRITGANMKCSFRGGYAITPYGAESLTSYPKYYKDGLINVTTQISFGPLFLSENSRKALFSLGVPVNLPEGAVDYPDKLFIKVTRLSYGASPKTYTLKEQNSPGNYGLLEMKLSGNGVYVVSAYADENMTKEILFKKPMVFVKADSFRENSGEGDDFDFESDVETITANGVSFKMVKVEGGSFMMGALKNDRDAYAEETPQHKVTLDTYSIGQTEVTQALWEAVMGSNPSNNKSPDNPVEFINRDEMDSFITKLNRLTGLHFRLPTEAEWEFAARGGKKSKAYIYAGSNNINEVAWFEDNSFGVTHPVAQKRANELGIYDMSGNVWEPSLDYVDWYYYSHSPERNPCNTVESSSRIIRGGGLDNIGRFCRATMRSDQVYTEDLSPVEKNYDIGIRLVLSDLFTKTGASAREANNNPDLFEPEGYSATPTPMIWKPDMSSRRTSGACASGLR